MNIKDLISLNTNKKPKPELKPRAKRVADWKLKQA